jgi:signal transduction histidine kinase
MEPTGEAKGDSIATTIALTVIVAMVLGFSLQELVSSGLLYLGVARQQTVRNGNPRLLLQLPGRIAVLLDVLDATPDTDRPIVVAAAQRPLIHVRLLDAPIPNLVNRGELDADLLRRRIEALLTVPRPVVVADSYRPADQRAGAGGGRVENGVFIEAALSDGHWLLFVSPIIPPPAVDPVATQFSRANFAAWLALSILLGILLSMLAAQRLVKPLSELALAVERLGGSGDAPPLPPRGPRELQVTIGAFNRMQERLRRFNQDRTRMLAAMSHDLRTPVTRMRLRLELLEDREQQQKMLAELDTMGEMIESVLSFARDDTKREPHSLVDFSALVEGICEDASDAGETVTYSGPRGVTIACRPTVVRRAISNLVDNAVKYGKSAAVSVISEAGRVVVTVEDEGPGIPRGEREKVFEPFYRIDRARNPDTGGVGLGLSVTRSIVWEHGGDIVLANRKGGGLSVRLELPIGSGSRGSRQQEVSSSGPTREPDLDADR